MESKGNFPDRENDKSAGAKAPGEKSQNENDWGKHHHVVPVENSAGCAAAVFHEPDPEWTPEKNADQIADIKGDGKNKKHISSDNSAEIENTDCGGEQKPDYSDFYGVAVAFFDICKEVFKISDILDFPRDKILKAEF